MMGGEGIEGCSKGPHLSHCMSRSTTGKAEMLATRRISCNQVEPYEMYRYCFLR